MAKKIDNEILSIQESNSEYAINPYTIQYDSKSKRFLKGFAPKVGSGALVSTLVFAGLSVATLFTGGVAALAGLGVTTVAGAAGVSVGVGTLWQTVNSGRVYLKNSSRSVFEAANIGGTEANPGTIAIVKYNEEQAREITELLEKNPNSKKLKLSDGAIYSRRDLKKRIKEKEDIAYHGLKYILEQGVYISSEIENLTKRANLTEYEENMLADYWDKMDRIGECVKNVASKRLNFNPYKALILDAMQQGCLLGNYTQNIKIREATTINNREKTLEIYFNMYEKDLLERNRAKRVIEPKVSRHEHNVVLEENQELKKELTKAQRGYKRNVETAWNYRADKKQLKKEKEQLGAELTTVKKSKNEALGKIGELEASLRGRDLDNGILKQRIAELEDVLTKASVVIEHYKKDNKSKQSAIDHLVVERKGWKGKAQELHNELDKVKKDYQQLVEDYNKEKITSAEFGKKVEILSRRLRTALGTVSKKSATIKSQQTKIDNLTEQRDAKAIDADQKERKTQNLEKTVADTTKMYNLAVGYAAEQVKQKKAYMDKAEKAEEKVAELNKKQAKLERRNETLKKRNETLQERVEVITGVADHYIKQSTELKENAELAENLGHDLHRTRKELDALVTERDAYKREVEDLANTVASQSAVVDEKHEQVVADASRRESHQYNFEFGQRYSNLYNLVDRVEAHTEYTKSQGEYDKRVVQGLERIIAKCRSLHPGEVSVNELVKYSDMLRSKYEECKSNLARISDKKLREFDEKIHTNSNFNK